MALPHQLLWEARHIAEKHNLYIIEVQDVIDHRLVTAYVLYRQERDGIPKQRLGKSRDPARLLRLVKHAAGVAA